MTTVFVGGSRRVARLPDHVKRRLDNVVRNNHWIVVGDAGGADKAVQHQMLGVGYRSVTVFCSGDSPRNNLGGWPVERIVPPRRARGFQFHAAKDRAMALRAHFGLMIWDGSSPGTVLNVLRLIRAGKSSVLINVSDSSTLTLKSASQWDEFLSRCSPQLRADLEERSTTDEWSPVPDDARPELPASAASNEPEPLLDRAASSER